MWGIFCSWECHPIVIKFARNWKKCFKVVLHGYNVACGNDLMIWLVACHAATLHLRANVQYVLQQSYLQNLL